LFAKIVKEGCSRRAYLAAILVPLAVVEPASMTQIPPKKFQRSG
jgi:hypothetical protein